MKSKFRVASTLVFFICLVALPATVNTAATQEQPTIAKDSLQITAFTFNVYKKNYDVWSWLPQIKYRVNGPIPSGGQLYVEFNLPTGPWVKFDCRTEATQPDYWLSLIHI